MAAGNTIASWAGRVVQRNDIVSGPYGRVGDHVGLIATGSDNANALWVWTPFTLPSWFPADGTITAVITYATSAAGTAYIRDRWGELFVASAVSITDDSDPERIALPSSGGWNVEQQSFQIRNRERTGAGLPPLEFHPGGTYATHVQRAHTWTDGGSLTDDAGDMIVLAMEWRQE